MMKKYDNFDDWAGGHLSESADIRDFYNAHKGETCIIVSLGPNLKLTPPEWFDYPSFSINSIFKYEGWKPDYYVGVDDRLWRENTPVIMDKLAGVPKFIPTPDRDDIQGPNLYRFYHRPGDIYIGGQMPTHPDAMTKRGIAYRRVLGAVFQIAYFMGFERMLVIGVQHKPGTSREHFWGHDDGVIVNQPLVHWFDEYRQWAHFGKAEVLNISEDTYVPENIIPRGNWRDWYTVETVTA